MPKPTRKKAKPTSDPIDFSAFDIDAPDLPETISGNAIASGGYLYPNRMKRKSYEKQLVELQFELLKLQTWARNSGERLVVLFEGRDAAGKGGTIKRFMEHLNPRHAHVIALAKPTEAEQGQWYFQRYVSHLPTAGDISLFDRSWYNRAGVERVMGFCTPEQVEQFLDEAPLFESALVRDGVRLFKFWLTIGREMQLKRFHDRRHDRLRHWKLSPIDLASIPKWEAYSEAKEDLFRHTHTESAPWTVIRANDKRRARLNAMRIILDAINYDGKDEKVVDRPDEKIVGGGPEFFFQA